MPFPGGVATVTVTKDYRNAAGEHPAVVRVSFIPSARKVVVSPALTIEPIPVFVTITNGLLSQVLAATVGFSYEVSEIVDGKQRPRYSVLVPGPGPYVLDSLAPIEPVIANYTPVRTVEGIGPDATGNVDLPASVGSAPSSRLIDTRNGLLGGGDLSADRILEPNYGALANTITQGNDPRLFDARNPLAHVHPQSDVTGLAASLAGKENTGVAAAGDTAHTVASDPHPQYLTPAEANALYAALAHIHALSDVTGLVSALLGKASKPVMREAWIKLGSNVNVNLNTGSGAWGPLPTFPTISIPAVVGDRVGLGVHAIRQLNDNLLVDFGVVVGGAVQRWLGGNYLAASPPPADYEGDAAIYHANLPAIASERRFTVASGDLDSGNVVFAVLVKAIGSGSALLLTSDQNPFYWQATNYGVVA